jgi:hypothetical protein
MSVPTSLFAVGRRWRLAAVLSLALLIIVGGSLTAWSARARSQAQEDALSAASDMTEVQPAALSPGIEPEEDTGAETPADAPSNASAPAGQASQPLAFTITWERTQTSPGGETRLLLTSRRYQRADGVFKLVNTLQGRDGVARTETHFGFMGFGTFRLAEARRQLVFAAPIAHEELPDVEAYLRANSLYDRTEDVRGQNTIVWRQTGEGGKSFTEEYRAPALGGLLIKRVISSARGQEVFEPTEITIGEPAAGLFAELSAYAMDYSHFEGRIREVERNGNKETALAMRRALSRMREARPDGR